MYHSQLVVGGIVFSVMNDKNIIVSRLERKDKLNKNLSKVAIQAQNQYHDYYLIVPIFVCAVKPFENSVNMNTLNKENNFKFYM